MNNWLKRFDIFMQEVRIDYLQSDQADELAKVEHHKAMYAQASMDLVCACLHLSKLKGEIPQPVRNVIPTQSQSFPTRLLFGRQGGFTDRNQAATVVIAAVVVALLLIGLRLSGLL